MHEVNPVCYETVYPFIGRRVCAVTHDGTHFIGTVKGVDDGRLMLEDCTIDEEPVSLSSVRNGKRSTKSRQAHASQKARLSGYYGNGYRGYGGYGGGCFFCPFVFIASLFILPFFFI